MKILILLILLAGGTVTFSSGRIANKFFKSEDEDESLANSVKIKWIGAGLVLTATVLMYFFA